MKNVELINNPFEFRTLRFDFYIEFLPPLMHVLKSYIGFFPALQLLSVLMKLPRICRVLTMADDFPLVPPFPPEQWLE
jgi:hypothetical protein